MTLKKLILMRKESESESVIFSTQKHNADRTTIDLRQRRDCEGTEWPSSRAVTFKAE